jgi:hypothetical protein
MDYVNLHLRSRFKNKAKTNPIKPNPRKAKMNVTSLITKDYRKKDDFAAPKNKPKSNPIQSQTNPIPPPPFLPQNPTSPRKKPRRDSGHGSRAKRTVTY